jgi:uncharacterized pyridoxal phosphate-containing UPF0001 family protein
VLSRVWRPTEDLKEFEREKLQGVIDRYRALEEEEELHLITERQRQTHRNIRQLCPRINDDDRTRLALAITQAAEEFDVTMYSGLFDMVVECDRSRR